MLFIQADKAPQKNRKQGGKGKKSDARSRDEGEKESKPWLKWVIMIAVILASVGITALVSRNANRQMSIEQSKFSIDYTVSFKDPAVKILDINVELGIDALSSEGLIYLYRNEVESDILSCVDDIGNVVDMNDTGSFQLISLGPIDPAARSVHLFYNVRLGNQSYSDLSLRNYGDLYDDLLVFCGENVLIGPLMDIEELTSVDKYISSVSFKLDADNGWDAIIPFRDSNSGDCSFTVERPTWSDFNAIAKSSFCFGQFDKMDVGDVAAVYVDRAVGGQIPDRSLEVFYSFLQYYLDRFGELSPEAPIVLLRNAPEDHAVILGGVGARGCAISADMNLGDECQTMTTTLFHLFFDSKIKAPNLRFVTNNWIYKGLSNYCVNDSADYLSNDIREAFSINDVGGDPERYYLKYLYFSLKEPGLLIVDPSMEGNMLQAQDAYYMGVKVPLMIDFIDHVIAQQSGMSFIQSLLEEAGDEKDLDINAFLKKMCGVDYQIVLQSFSGNVLIPNYGDFCIDETIPDEEIIDTLLNDEDYFSYLFEEDYVYYEYPPLFLLDPDKFFPAAEEMGVHYNNEEIQNEVKAFSKTLHQLLMQYAVMAKFAGVDDITVPKASRDIFTNEAFEGFSAFCESLGYVFNYDD